jgi:hypothetical protein
MRVCYTLWNHDYCIIKCFLGHKFLRSIKTHTHGSSLQCLNTQFNSILQVSQDPLLHVNIFIQMRRAWNLNVYYVWETMTAFSHTMMYGCQQRGDKNKSVQNNTVLLLWRQLWNRGNNGSENKSVHNNRSITVLLLWRQNYETGVKTSVDKDAALSLWRQNSITMVTTALKTAVFTTT